VNSVSCVSRGISGFHKVKAGLLATENVSGTAINVDTKDGVVTLTGNVESKTEADKAVSVSGGIEGATKVQSELTISAAARK
jgi:hyperosmotically inducible protein